MRIAVLFSSLANACEDGWVDDFQGNCLKIVDQAAPWHSALDYCFNEGAHMLHIPSEDYNDAILNLQISKGSNIWIGYESPERMTGFFNSDGVSAAWNNFKITGETDGRTSAEHNCASLIENGKWKKNDCFKSKPFVCQKETRLEKNEVTDAIFTAIEPCLEWSETVISCGTIRRAQTKISNYKHRFDKVAKDASWHVMAVKNCRWPSSGERFKRFLDSQPSDTFTEDFDSIYREFFAEFETDMAETDWLNISFDDEVRLSKENVKYEKAKNYVEGAKQCSGAMKQVWKSEYFRKCPKLGSWKRRTNGLVESVRKMMQICIKNL